MVSAQYLRKLYNSFQLRLISGAIKQKHHQTKNYIHAQVGNNFQSRPITKLYYVN